jgi:hypothetical protein
MSEFSIQSQVTCLVLYYGDTTLSLKECALYHANKMYTGQKCT